MARRSRTEQQLDMFAPPAAPKAKLAVDCAPHPPHLSEIRRQLPHGLSLGTSSWSFPGWRGIVFAADAPKTRLARHGLAAYAQHPLLRAVGLDRTYYAPLAPGDYAAYAGVVPASFRFLVKAHELCTLAMFRAAGRYPGRGGERNERFLDPDYAAEHVVAPCIEGLGEKAGPLLFQFPPQNIQALGGRERFVERLHAFLKALPRGPLYAVELRNAELLTTAYCDALLDTGTVHCFNVHPSMPPSREQYRLAGAAAAPALVVRWMLHPTQRYEAARSLYEPCDRLVDEDPSSRQAIADMCLDAAAAQRPAVVIVNNKAEGSSPLTIVKLAEHLIQVGRRGLQNDPHPGHLPAEGENLNPGI
jgi:uncharacterized protein YecE (DUF72 family)